MISKTYKRTSFIMAFKEVYRLWGNPGGLIRWNLFLVWLALVLALWVLNPIKALPYPSEVWAAAQRLFDDSTSRNLVYNTWVILKLNVVGLTLATALSLAISYLSVLPLFQPLNRAVQALRYIPVIGFNLMFLTLFAIGWQMKLAMFVTGMSFFLVTSMTGVIAGIPRLKYELASVLGYSNRQIFYSVVVRPTLPQMIEAVAQNAAIGWVMIVAIETFNRQEGGIGSQICVYNDTNQLAEAYVYMIFIGIIAIVEDWFFSLLRRGLFPQSLIVERG